MIEELRFFIDHSLCLFHATLIRLVKACAKEGRAAVGRWGGQCQATAARVAGKQTHIDGLYTPHR